MNVNTLRVGARGSKLSLTQSQWVADKLRLAHPGLTVQIIIIQTTGDKLRDVSLTVLGGLGIFTKEIETALLKHQIDVAVHSLKDLPTSLPERLQLGAITEREDPLDCLVAAAPVDLGQLGPDDRIGTSSLRRQAQLLKINPRLNLVEFRGNVPTRIQKMLSGEVRALVLAAAGMNRLGLQPPWMCKFDASEMLPAPGQGALGIEVRSDDDYAKEMVAVLNDPASWSACAAERAFLRAFGGGCRAPIAALGEADGEMLRLQGMISSGDATQFYRDSLSGPIDDPQALGAELAQRLKKRGASVLMEHTLRQEQADLDRLTPIPHGPLSGKCVVVTRDEDADGPLSSALRDAGAEPLVMPLISEAPPEDMEPLERAVRRINDYDWIVFSSNRAVQVLGNMVPLKDVRARLACVGPNTAAAVYAISNGQRTADVLATQWGAQGLLKTLRASVDLYGARILYPRSEQALSTMKDGLMKIGAQVDDPIAYRTVRGAAFGTFSSLLGEGKCDAITFASPSAAEAFFDALGEKALDMASHTIIASIGPTTSKTLRQLGIEPQVEAQERTYVGLVKALAESTSY